MTITAIFFYYFGWSSFIFIFFIFLISFCLFFKRSILSEMDRLVASVLSIFIGALGLALHGFNGGVIGQWQLQQIVALSHDIMIIRSLVYALFSICVVVQTREIIFYGIKILFAPSVTIKNLFYQFFLFWYHLFSGMFIERSGESMMSFEYDIALPEERSLSELAQQKASQKKVVEAQKSLNVTNNKYVLPNKNILTAPIETASKALISQASMKQQAAILEDKLSRFGVQGKVIRIKQGPVVTLFEYQPDVNAKISKIIALEDDLAMALEAHSIRIMAPIPGRAVVGFEVSNIDRIEVQFSKIISSAAYQQFQGDLPLILGENSVGEDMVIDLALMPHLLIAGSTGSGKSVCLNTMLLSLLYSCSPDDVKLILIDPKRLEFSSYSDIAHLLFPVVTQPKEAITVLRWVVQEMNRRYDVLAAAGARNVHEYRSVKRDADKQMPLIVVIIDEFADLMMTASYQIEDLIIRIAQMARAAGIHLILATQRPSVDVITGLIKANFASRISFRVSSRVDSRVILDQGGAEKLLGRGDMLFLGAQDSALSRIHGAYVSNDDIANITSYIRAQRGVVYTDLASAIVEEAETFFSEDEQLYQDVLSFVKTIDEVSISLLQRRFRIGYNRSARIVDMLELHGVITSSEAGKARKVIR